MKTAKAAAAKARKANKGDAKKTDVKKEEKDEFDMMLDDKDMNK